MTDPDHLGLLDTYPFQSLVHLTLKALRSLLSDVCARWVASITALKDNCLSWCPDWQKDAETLLDDPEPPIIKQITHNPKFELLSEVATALDCRGRLLGTTEFPPGFAIVQPEDCRLCVSPSLSKTSQGWSKHTEQTQGWTEGPGGARRARWGPTMVPPKIKPERDDSS